MQRQYCQIHERQACVVDLNISKLLCQKCALFDAKYKHHQFIDLPTLPQYSINLYNKFKQDLQTLNLNLDKDAQSKWKTISSLSKKHLNQKLKEINIMYDEMISQIQRQRKQKIGIIVEQIQKIIQDCNQSVNLIIGDKYQQLMKKNQYLRECVQKEVYLDVTKELMNRSYQDVVCSVGKDLDIILIDIQQKFNMVNQPVPTTSDFSRRRISVRQELLISNQPSTQLQFVHPPWKTQRPMLQQEQRRPVSEIITIRNPQTQRLSTIQSIDLDMSASQIDLKRKNSKKISSKQNIKGIVLKSTIKEVQMTDINMNNRQALDAIKKCGINTFVNIIDVSNNPINSDLILMLKRQKGFSKSLKKIVMRGVKLNESGLKKEGVNIDSLKDSKYKIGQISIII